MQFAPLAGYMLFTPFGSSDVVVVVVFFSGNLVKTNLVPPL